MKKTLVKQQTAVFELTDSPAFKAKALQWSRTFDQISFLDNNEHQSHRYQSQECLLAVGAHSELKINEAPSAAFPRLREYVDQTQDWIFGFLAYDLKNDLEKLSSTHPDGLGFPLLYFFQPEYLLKWSTNQVWIQSKGKSPAAIFQEINAIERPPVEEYQRPSVDLQSRFSKADYLQTVERIRQHIIEGDVYELNFCQEFFAKDCQLDPWKLFAEFNDISQAPFTSFYRLEDQFLLCASPERFLKKVGRKVISQPIKGTIGRGKDAEEDQRLGDQLYHSIKDRAENVMIVDLVRNDLARTCQAGTVVVEELFGIYAFPQVQQMISTVTGELREEQHAVDAIANAFPMGSMTGAPKVMSMELIEKYERSRRGLYSGAVGYFDPAGDFDFNVVIRSMLYQAERQYLSFQVGGAIVYDSEPELEFAECMLKAKGMRKVLGL